jgi:hypothetical protein
MRAILPAALGGPLIGVDGVQPSKRQLQQRAQQRRSLPQKQRQPVPNGSYCIKFQTRLYQRPASSTQ